MKDFSHFNTEGHAHMVNVGDKPDTHRIAVASGRVLMNPNTLELIKTGGLAKGDVLGTAQIAGIMGAKRTSDLIPMCHPILFNGADIKFIIDESISAVEIRAEVHSHGSTGVEMEALMAVSTAALTIYDMCKAVEKGMKIDNIRLIKKTGGKSGDYINE